MKFLFIITRYWNVPLLAISSTFEVSFCYLKLFLEKVSFVTMSFYAHITRRHAENPTEKEPSLCTDISKGPFSTAARLFAIFFIYSYNVCVFFAGSFWSISISFDFFPFLLCSHQMIWMFFFSNSQKRLYTPEMEISGTKKTRKNITTKHWNFYTQAHDPVRVSVFILSCSIVSAVYALFWFHFT